MHNFIIIKYITFQDSKMDETKKPAQHGEEKKTGTLRKMLYIKLVFQLISCQKFPFSSLYHFPFNYYYLNQVKSFYFQSMYNFFNLLLTSKEICFMYESVIISSQIRDFKYRIHCYSYIIGCPGSSSNSQHISTTVRYKMVSKYQSIIN